MGGRPATRLPRRRTRAMDMNRFTEKVQEALAAAQQRASRLGHQQLDVEHLLLAFLEQEPGLANSILRKAEVNVETLRQRLERELDRIPKVSDVSGGADQVYLSGRLNRLLTQAQEEARRLKDEYVSIEHLLNDDPTPETHPERFYRPIKH